MRTYYHPWDWDLDGVIPGGAGPVERNINRICRRQIKNVERTPSLVGGVNVDRLDLRTEREKELDKGC